MKKSRPNYNPRRASLLLKSVDLELEADTTKIILDAPREYHIRRAVEELYNDNWEQATRFLIYAASHPDHTKKRINYEISAISKIIINSVIQDFDYFY